METTLTLAELQRRQIAVAPHEAVAVAQQLMHECVGNAGARPPFGPPSLDTVAIAATGTVLCTRSDATPSVPEVAIVLQELIAHSPGRVPGGLRYAIGRALLEVEAPPFDTAEEFSQALERFEHGARSATLAALYARAAEAEPATPVSTAAAGDGDRRRHTPSATEIRRQLRDADLRLYQIQQLAQGGVAAASPSRPRSLRGPVVACMLTGIALVAAGEAARGVPVHQAADATPITASRIAPSAPPASAADIPLPVAAIQPPPAPLAARAPASTRTTARRRAARTRPAPVAARNVPRRDAKPAVRPKPDTRDDDRGLLRIRFVWDNPFK